jgi:hypothetical protein
MDQDIEIKANPNPEYLIKSISEQGYSLETAIADLIDNSITAEAKRIEILSFKDNDEFSLLIADNGNGMSHSTLKSSMMFPSSNMDNNREKKDLGRFGLGLKTASFSQSRKFTVISKLKGDLNSHFNGLTWDVDKLNTDTGWIIFRENENKIKNITELYLKQSRNHLENSEEFLSSYNTLICWYNMRKFSFNESYLQQLELVKEYLGIVFHSFIENHNLTIRFNGEIITPFNPFPTNGGGLFMDESQYLDSINGFKMRGFIVNPDSKNNEKIWTTKNKSLFDLEGVYIYRNERLIFFGGWNGLRKRTSKLKLARLKINFDNSNDTFFMLNVDKSKVTIPYSVKRIVVDYVEKLEEIATRQYYNRTIDGNSLIKKSKLELIVRGNNNKGRCFEFNNEFPLLKELNDSLNEDQRINLKTILRMIQVSVNKITETHEDKNFITIDHQRNNDVNITMEEIEHIVFSFKNIGWSSSEIEKVIIQNMGFEKSDLIKQFINDIDNKQS